MRCCFECLKASTVSAYTLEHRYGVPSGCLEGLSFYRKQMSNDWCAASGASCAARLDIGRPFVQP